MPEIHFSSWIMLIQNLAILWLLWRICSLSKKSYEHEQCLQIAVEVANNHHKAIKSIADLNLKFLDSIIKGQKPDKMPE